MKFLAAILFALALAFGGCAKPAQPAYQLSAIEQLYLDGVKACTVWHLKDKLWVTASHCTNGAATLTDKDGRPFTVLRQGDIDGEKPDLSLLIGPPGAPDLDIGAPPAFGDPVHFIGYPQYGGETHLGVYSGSWGTCYVVRGSVHKLCEVSVMVDGGASGAPLFDEYGRVVGVVDASFRGRQYGYVVSTLDLYDFLREAGAI